MVSGKQLWGLLLLFWFGKEAVAAGLNPTPFLTPPIVEGTNGTFRLSCYVGSMYTGVDTDEARVDFYADGKRIFKVSRITLARRTRVDLPLDLFKDNINKVFDCRARLYRSPGNSTRRVDTHWRKSNQRFLGIRATPEKLIIGEDSTSSVSVVSTIPILCERQSSTRCCLTLNLQLGGASNNLAVISSCHYEICSTDWNNTTFSAQVEIPVLAARDDIDDGDQDVSIRFRPLLPSGGGMTHLIWEDVQVNEVEVKVADVPPGVCQVHGDPHVRTFEQPHRVHFYTVGDFVLYQSPGHQLQVHGRTWPCGRSGRASCLCGVVAREGDDAVEVSICHTRPTTAAVNKRALTSTNHHDRHTRHDQRGPPGPHHRGPPGHHGSPTSPPHHTHHNGPTHEAASIKTSDLPLSTGFTIQRDPSGRHFVITLPSGTKVKVDVTRNSLGFTLTLPPAHVTSGDGRGICGTYDRNQTNDLTDRHGLVHQCLNTRHCQPHDFIKSWRLRRNETLFLNPPKALPLAGPTRTPMRAPNGTRYCGCHDNGQVSTTVTALPAIDCSGDADKPIQRLDCVGCVDVTGEVPPGLYGGNWIADSAAATPYEEAAFMASVNEQLTFDPFAELDEQEQNSNASSSSQTWPTSGNVTESGARQRCLAAVRASASFSRCARHTAMVAESADDCVDDFLRADGDTLLPETTRSFNALCLDTLQKDPTTYEGSNSGNGSGHQRLRVKQEIADVLCDQDCLANGQCRSGQCVCEAGWVGSNCQLEEARGVELKEAVNGATCNGASGRCKNWILKVSNVERTDHLVCHFQVLNNTAWNIKAEFWSKGTLTPNSHLLCPFHKGSLVRPHGLLPAMNLRVSATFDGRTYGNVLPLTIVHSPSASLGRHHPGGGQ